ncbi:hypothetical protein CCH79_00005751, partial [Gambusia affinis]
MGDKNLLIIRNVSKEDEATYFCQTGAAYQPKFVNGTNLIVNDMKLILLGTSVTLQCSLHSEEKEKQSTDQCADKHDVFWFRAESKSNPGFIYADKKRCNKQAGSSCGYRLSKTIRSSSDTGTYYCAVVTCGEILFGEGTKVETSVIQTLQIPDKIPLTEAELGQTVNLTCNITGLDNGLFYWYKINSGHKVQTVAGGRFDKVKLDQHFLNSRFESRKVEDTYCLIIKNVSKEDEATYLCHAGSAYKMTFVNGTNLVVN